MTQHADTPRLQRQFPGWLIKTSLPHRSVCGLPLWVVACCLRGVDLQHFVGGRVHCFQTRHSVASKSSVLVYWTCPELSSLLLLMMAWQKRLHSPAMKICLMSVRDLSSVSHSPCLQAKSQAGMVKVDEEGSLEQQVPERIDWG